MKELIAIAAFTAAALFPSAAEAGTYQGKVYWIHIMNDGWVLVHAQSPVTGAPCQFNNRFIFSWNTPFGKHLLQIITMAYAMGTDLYIAGDGTCPGHGAEQIGYLTTAP